MTSGVVSYMEGIWTSHNVRRLRTFVTGWVDWIFGAMGARLSNFDNADYIVYITTGDKKGAGTDGNVFFALHDEGGKRSKDYMLDTKWHDDFEAGSTDTFPVRDCKDFKHLSSIEIWRDETNKEDNWFVDKVVVKRCRDKEQSIFPVHRWIPAECHMKLKEFDCCLPQHEENIEQRNKELEAIRNRYGLKVQQQGLTAQVQDLPEDELFSNEYQWDLDTTKLKLGLTAKLTAIMTGKFESLDDLRKVYGETFKQPYGMDNWRSDVEFGSQRLTGCNPTVIRGCRQIPDSFAVTAEMVEPLLEGRSLEECLNTKRLYYVDYKVLDNLPCTDGRKICAPFGLFYVNNIKKLVPVAIQLEQIPGPDNPVFLPTDPEYTWMLAKMWFNLADCSFHQAATHLGLTHLVMEFVTVVTHRQLSPSHPVFRLLAPHFLYLIAINTRALNKLVAKDGWVDQTMTIGRIGMFSIISRVWDTWSLDAQGTLPKDLIHRGVDDVEALPHYHYRDDALLLYNAIHNYIANVVNGIYDSPDKIINDTELQAWIAELNSPPEGPPLKGVPAKLEIASEIVDVLTALVFTASVQHAAANFSQYDEYAFPPNYPAFLNGDRPQDKQPRTEADIVDALPDKQMTLSVMIVTKILSSRGTKCLADFEVQYAHDPVSVEALEKFRKELSVIEKEIDQRDATRDNKYPYLSPREVPNAISI